MDNETRTEAYAKLDKMAWHIGYPDELMDDKKIEEFYEGLEVDENQLFTTSLNILKFIEDKSSNDLRKINNKTDWKEHASSAFINALYNAIENSIRNFTYDLNFYYLLIIYFFFVIIEFPAAFLQHPFFSVDRPNYMNYGALGYFIGHEITHGFDDEGSQLDSNGEMRKWWNDKTKDSFLDRARCIIEQYGNFTDPVTQKNVSFFFYKYNSIN